MNLEDLLSEGGLQQDEWSRLSPTFGKEGQLTVLGCNSGKGNRKYYILRCAICLEDAELFGEGYFKTLKDRLFRGQIPCGCAFNPKWSEDQYKVICSRKAEELHYKFLGFTGEWKGCYTKISMFCEKHGEWNTGIVNDLIHKGVGCPGCKSAKITEAKTKPDNVMIDSFFASGCFHPETKFWRSDRATNQGIKSYWFMLCPECGEVGESFHGDLRRGCRPCGCSHMRQRECYINLVCDSDNVVALKFGIANNSKQRIKNQNFQSSYTLKQHSIYKFPDVASCKAAERECKEQFICGIIPKQEMSDGYTETTYIYNLDKIKQIYIKHGGVEVWPSL